MGWLSGWIRRKIKGINASPDGTLTNYQMKVTVHKGTGIDDANNIYFGGNCLDDFGDIRFTSSDGTTVLSYWIESYILGTSAIMWIKIPSIYNGSYIYVYYDNSGATSLSNYNDTFTPYYTHSGGTYDGISQYDTIPYTSPIYDNITVEFSFNCHTIPSSYASQPLTWGVVWASDTPPQWAFTIYYHGLDSGGQNNKVQVLGIAGGTWNVLSALSGVLSLNTTYSLKWEYNSSIGGQLYINDVPVGGKVGSGTLLNTTSDMYIARLMKTVSDQGRAHNWFDGSVTNIIIRPFIAVTTPPTWKISGVEGTQVYVKLTGNDTNNGTSWTNAKLTINAGINITGENFIHIGFGDYSTQSIITLNKTMELLCETADIGGGNGTVVLPATT